jgi:hypothetical protein
MLCRMKTRGWKHFLPTFLTISIQDEARVQGMKMKNVKCKNEFACSTLRRVSRLELIEEMKSVMICVRLCMCICMCEWWILLTMHRLVIEHTNTYILYTHVDTFDECGWTCSKKCNWPNSSSMSILHFHVYERISFTSVYWHMTSPRRPWLSQSPAGHVNTSPPFAILL